LRTSLDRNDELEAPSCWQFTPALLMEPVKGSHRQTFMRILLAVSATLLAAACGNDSLTTVDPPSSAPGGPAPTATTTAGVQHDQTGIDQPPPFRVRYNRNELAVYPHTYCYDSGCVDGFDANPTDIGSPREIKVHVPVRELELSVHARELTREPRADQPFFEATCGGRSFDVPVEDLGDGWYLVRPFGPAAHYDIELFARGGGDMIGALRWRTPADGPMPEPSARLALIADNDGEPDSHGLELAIDDLAATPARASAEIEVTAGDGRSVTLHAEESKVSCRSAGDLYFDHPDKPAKAAAQLGDFPFTTTVTLTLDGRTYRATAVYPDDEIKGNEPSVSLQFMPKLPAL
jgi:hypothetical protein